MGSDLAGTVVEVGSKVTKWKVEDRVMAHAFGASIGQSAKSAFQKYVVVDDWVPTPVPDNVALENAVVLPLASDTAAAGLFVQLGLSTSTIGEKSSNGEAILIWGGSSSVGCAAIQMAHAAGYDVLATASARNHGLCESLGAKAVFDYGEVDVEDQIVGHLKGKRVAGVLDCIADSEKTIPACGRILKQGEGRRKIVAVLQPVEIEGVETQRGMYSMHLTRYQRTQLIVSVSIPHLFRSEQYGKVHKWMSAALKDGSLQSKPNPMIVGHGLESIQKGVDVSRKGVSAAKVVVKLE